MADVWNPFDPNNPVYVQVAKNMKSTRRRVRAGFLIVGGLTAAYLYNKKGGSNMFGVKTNQFGVIRRK